MEATLKNAGADEAIKPKVFNASYNGRAKMSDMQVMAAHSRLQGQKASEAEAAALLPAPVIIAEDVAPKVLPPSRPNPSLDSQLKFVFAPTSASTAEGDEGGGSSTVPYDTAAVDPNALIGGMAFENESERWMTTDKYLANGNSLSNIRPKGLKRVGGVPDPSSMISPVTGELVGDYGTWAQDKVDAMNAAYEAAQQAALDRLEDEREGGGDPIINKLRTQLANKGAKGQVGIHKWFKSMDEDGNNLLSKAEFKRAMKLLRMDLSEEQCSALFTTLDVLSEGSINFPAFARKVTGKLNARRKRLVNMAFGVLDKDGSGQIDMEDIAVAYDVTMHPEFITGKRSREDILREFLDAFDVGGEKDGIVTKEEFQNYYEDVSSSIQNDDYFELMIRNAWHISGGYGSAANSANLRVLVTHSDGTQTVQELRNDMGIKKGDKAEVVKRLRLQGLDVAAIPGYEDKRGAAAAVAAGGPFGPPPPPAPVTASAAAAAVAASSSAKLSEGSGAGGGSRRPSNSGSASQFVVARAPSLLRQQIKEQQAAETHPLCEKLRESIKARGANGFIGLQRSFRLMDEDDSGSLDMNEFKRALKNINVLLSEKQSKDLFSFFDQDNSGSITYNEFLVGVRGDMSPSRLSLVSMAFNVLDKDGSGVIEPADLVSCYDTSKHPDVIAKRKTREQVLKDFLETFDVGGEVDGKVTRQEFINYYSNISASVDNDEYFELMIRNAWHISGGVGAAANSANLRVLVTHSDGSQSVQEVRNDLGLAQGDKDGLTRRLRKQGTDFASFDTRGGVEEAKNDNSANRRRFTPPVTQGPSREQTEDEIKNLKGAALAAFGANSFEEAANIFACMMALLVKLYGPSHPEVLKAQKSVQMCEKRQNSVDKQRNVQKK